MTKIEMALAIIGTEDVENVEVKRLLKTYKKAELEAQYAEIIGEVAEEEEPMKEEVVAVKEVPAQELIDTELAKRAEFINAKYTPKMKRTTVLNRDNLRGMFYMEVQKKAVVFHSKEDMVPENYREVMTFVKGNKPNPYAVKVTFDDLAVVLAQYLARVERVRIARKAK